jgi:hypothetical protein
MSARPGIGKQRSGVVRRGLAETVSPSIRFGRFAGFDGTIAVPGCIISNFNWSLRSGATRRHSRPQNGRTATSVVSLTDSAVPFRAGCLANFACLAMGQVS